MVTLTRILQIRETDVASAFFPLTPVALFSLPSLCVHSELTLVVGCLLFLRFLKNRFQTGNELGALGGTQFADILLPPAHGGQFSGARQGKQIPIRFSLFEGKQKPPVRIGHLANGKINQSFPGISESLEGHGFGSHSEKDVSKLGF